MATRTSTSSEKGSRIAEAKHEQAQEADETQPLMGFPQLKRDAIVSVAFAGLAGILLGVDVGMIAGVINPIHDHFDIGNFRTEIFVGSLNAMAFFGCFLASWLADRYGRRATLALAAGLFFVGNTLQALSLTYSMLLFGRSLAGVAVGFTLIVAPMYTAEVSPAQVRGMLTTLMEVAFNTGIVIGFFLTWAMKDMDDDVSWRLIMGIGGLPSIVLFAGAMFIMVESPRWLAMQGRLTEAQAIFEKVMEPGEGEKVLEQLSAQSAAEEGGSWWELFTDPKLNRPLFIGSMVAFFSQATGIESIQYYSVHILSSGAGFDRSTVLLLTLCMGLVKFAVIFVAGYFVDRVGRRPLLMTSGLGMAASMALLATTANNDQDPSQVVGMIGFVVFFSLGYGPLLYVINGEIYPQAARSKGMSFAMSVARALSATVSISFLSLAGLLTYRGVWSLFGVLSLSSVVFIYFCLPETRGKSLEETL